MSSNVWALCQASGLSYEDDSNTLSARKELETSQKNKKNIYTDNVA